MSRDSVAIGVAAAVPPRDLLGRLFELVDRHRGNGDQADDYTAVVLQFDPEPRSG